MVRCVLLERYGLSGFCQNSQIAQLPDACIHRRSGSRTR